MSRPESDFYSERRMNCGGLSGRLAARKSFGGPGRPQGKSRRWRRRSLGRARAPPWSGGSRRCARRGRPLSSGERQIRPRSAPAAPRPSSPWSWAGPCRWRRLPTSPDAQSPPIPDCSRLSRDEAVPATGAVAVQGRSPSTGPPTRPKRREEQEQRPDQHRHAQRGPAAAAGEQRHTTAVDGLQRRCRPRSGARP